MMILKYCQLFLRTECYERIVSVYLLNMKICAYLLDMTLFVCLDFIVPEENFTHNCRRHHYRWKPASFDLNSVRTGMSIEQRGFFSVLHLLWHGSSVYNGHLQEPVTLTPITVRKFGNGSVTTCLRLRSVAVGVRTPNLSLAGQTL